MALSRPMRDVLRHMAGGAGLCQSNAAVVGWPARAWITIPRGRGAWEIPVHMNTVRALRRRQLIEFGEALNDARLNVWALTAEGREQADAVAREHAAEA